MIDIGEFGGAPQTSSSQMSKTRNREWRTLNDYEGGVKMITNKSRFWKMMLAISILLMVVITAGCSSSSAATQKTASSPAGGQVRSNSGGSVTIAVTWLGVKAKVLSFDIVMDTHSVDLDQYDLGKLTILTDDKGNEYSLVSWNSQPGGHHRTGKLTFSQVDPQVKPGKLELTISNVAGVSQRTFTWDNTSYEGFK
jgi:hypothetical protein